MQKQRPFKKDFVLLCLQAALVSFSIGATAPLIPSIAATFGQKSLIMGRISWLYMIPYGACALLWAPLTHRVTVKQLLNISFLFFSLCLLGMGCAQSASGAFVMSFLMGVCGSSTTPLALILIGHSIKTHKGKYVGAYFSGTFIASLASQLLSSVLPWRFIYIIPGILGVMLSVMTFLCLARFDLRQSSVRITYHRTLKNSTVFRFVVLIFFSSFMYHTIHQWLGVYFKEQRQLSQFLTSLFFAFFSICAFGLEFWGGFITDQRKKTEVFKAGLLMMFFFISGMFLLRHSNPLWLLLLVPLWGGGWAFSHVGLSSYLASLPDVFLRDTSSLNSAVRFLSGGLGAWYGGKMIQTAGFSAHYIITAAFFLVLWRISGWLVREHEIVA